MYGNHMLQGLKCHFSAHANGSCTADQYKDLREGFSNIGLWIGLWIITYVYSLVRI